MSDKRPKNQLTRCGIDSDMSLTFFLDEQDARAALASFSQSAPNAMLVSSEGTRRWDGMLPTRVGDYFYESPWVLYSNSKNVAPTLDLSTFSADHFKNPKEIDLSFSVEGTFAGDDNEGEVSAYRVHDYATFAYFVGLVNQVYPFDILPGTLSLDACQTARRMARCFDFSSPLHLTPWYLVYDGGEIDTSHALFVAADNSTTLHFAREAGEALSFVMCF